MESIRHGAGLLFAVVGVAAGVALFSWTNGDTHAAPGCDLAYPDFCISPRPPDLDCADIPYSDFTVYAPDPHGFHGDSDGRGCESTGKPRYRAPTVTASATQPTATPSTPRTATASATSTLRPVAATPTPRPQCFGIDLEEGVVQELAVAAIGLLARNLAAWVEIDSH